MSETLLRDLEEHLSETHALVRLDNQLVVLQKKLTINQIKRLALPERSVSADDAAAWIIWLQGKQIDDDTTIDKLLETHDNSQELQLLLRHEAEPTVQMIWRELESGKSFTFNQMPQSLGRSEELRTRQIAITFGIREKLEITDNLKYISVHHLDLDLVQDKIILRNQNSHKATHVNRILLKLDQEVTLKVGDVIGVSDINFEVTSISIVLPKSDT